MSFRTGKFDKARIHPFLRRFAPVQSAESIYDIKLEELKAAGKTLILIDVDNTLVVWRSKEIAEATHDWVDKAQALGFKLCIISNTRNVERLKHLAERLEIEYMIGKFKPSRYMYLQALEKYGAKPEQAVMVGDQLFTDVFGANRSGIDAIWVKQMAPIDLITTKINRFGERVLSARLYAALHKEEDAVAAVAADGKTKVEEEEVEEDLAIGGTAAFELLQIPLVRQFVKFAIVGITSTAIDKGLLILLVEKVRLGDALMSDVLGEWLVKTFPSVFGYASARFSEASVPVLNTLTAGLAILNSFIWNRRWTFKIKGKEHRGLHLRKFLLVAITGFILNVGLTTVLHVIIKGPNSLVIASLIATVLVAFWNFGGQKLWTFKHKH